MAPYWERRVEGHRFFDWLVCFFGVVNMALLLLGPQPRDWHTYLGMTMCSLIALAAAYRLIKGTRSDA